MGDVELDLLPFFQAAAAATGDGAEVHEHVRAALDRDEAVAFVAVEPLHGALRHLDPLVVHAVPRHSRGRARHLLWPACHGTRGTETAWLADCLAWFRIGWSRRPGEGGFPRVQVSRIR